MPKKLKFSHYPVIYRYAALLLQGSRSLEGIVSQSRQTVHWFFNVTSKLVDRRATNKQY